MEVNEKNASLKNLEQQAFGKANLTRILQPNLYPEKGLCPQA